MTISSYIFKFVLQNDMTANKTTLDDLTWGHDSHVDPLKEQFSKMTVNQDDDKVPLLKPVEQAKEDGTRAYAHTQTHTHTPHTHHTQACTTA